MPQQILCVETDDARAGRIADALERSGFVVLAASGFNEALSCLKTASIAVLITAVRLGPYNGLHLVMRARAQNARVGAILTTPSADPVLQADVAAFGAEYLVAPWDDPAGLVETVSRVMRAEPV